MFEKVQRPQLYEQEFSVVLQSEGYGQFVQTADEAEKNQNP